jgi:AraC-like DNA-binding protein
MIKGMVCERCISVIKEGVTNLGFDVLKISLGRISINSELDNKGLNRVNSFLSGNGFEPISNRQVRIVNQVKEIINEVLGTNVKYEVKPKFSSLLSEKLNLNYDSISQLFTEMEGMTLEKYIITRRLDKVKELLAYTDSTLTEIAYITGFSSINHLSRQFKDLTGFAPSHFKSIHFQRKRIPGNYSDI